ncbi:MAG: hypothetical protein K8F30_07800 [Taibaiella sp.]|nr:hypothetical protein [Taibaiella sp.]
MKRETQNNSKLIDISGMFDADTISKIKGGYTEGIEDVLDEMIRDAFVNSSFATDDNTPKWTFNERVYIADLVRLLKLVARILCKVTQKTDTVMLGEKDAEGLHVQIMEICDREERATNLRYLEELMITQLTAPAMIGEMPLKEQIDSTVFYYKFLKGIISSFNPGCIEQKLAA